MSYYCIMQIICVLMCTKCLAHTNGQILALCQRWLSKGRQVEMSEGVLGIPKKAFLYGSPSRNEDHSKKKSLPYQSGTKIRKRPVITKTGVQKNKVLGLPPNSLDFKQLHKSSLVNNNLLKFRKVRQTKGTPIWIKEAQASALLWIGRLYSQQRGFTFFC